MALLLYVATAVLVLLVVHRFVRPLSRGAAILLLILPLFLTGKALVTGGVYGPVDHLYQYEPLSAQAAQFGIHGARNASAVDVWSEFFPWRLAVKESFARGEWPLWNAYNLAGHPLAAEVQSAPYSPFTWIACLLPAAVSMSYTAAIALFLAGVCAFVFARELGCSEAASLVAAIGWGLAPCIVLYTQTAMGFATLYAPLILAATRRVVREPGLRSGALLMTALALCALAGHPESLFLNVLVGGIYGVFELVRRRANPLRAIVTAIGAGLAAFLLCAISLLPLLEAMPQSVEYQIKGEAWDRASRGLPRAQVLAALATDVFPHLHVRQWESPKLGYIGAETAAVGSIVLALALLALWRRREAETWFFASLAVPCILAGARWAPIADALHALPLLDVTMHNRLAFHGALCLIVLAALGADRLDRRAAIPFAVLLVALAIGFFLVRRSVVLAVTPADYGRFRVVAEFAFLAAAALLLAIRPRVAFVIALLLGQRVLSEVDTFGTFPAKAAYPPIAALEPLGQIREPFRIVGTGLALPPASSTFYGLEDIRGYEALTLDQFARTRKLWSRPHGIWFHRVDDLGAPILSMMNVRFAVQSDSMPVPPGWRRIASGLVENTNALPRAFVPSRVTLTGASTDEIVDRMAAVRDFRTTAFITSRESPGEVDNGPGVIAMRAYSRAGRYLFDATMQRDGYVVISNASWRGWQAWIDGRRAPLHRANAAFLAVKVPQGRHEVRLRYWPRSFERGRWISGVMLLVVIAAMITAAVRR